jgi:acetyltransferase-like isoleucine patch superfamily enzyme
VELGPGAVISPFTIITTNVRIGASLQMHVFSGIGHDVRVGDYVTFSPYAVATGQSTIGDGASLFTKSTISPGCSVGARAVVGTGAVVLRDVPDDTTVVGLPARPMG